MEEIWKPIIIDDEIWQYEVSSYGQVRNINTGKIRKIQRRKNGYMQVLLNKGSHKKMFYVHRLVTLMFIPNDDPINKTQVNHIDENKENNCVSNLEWVTPTQNVNHGTRNARASEKNKGKTWKLKQPRTEEYKRKMSETLKKNGSHNGGKNASAKKVKCIETGQVFNTIKEASEWCGKKSVSSCLNGKCKTAGGYHWEFI